MKKTLLLAAFISAFAFSTQAAAAKKGGYCDSNNLTGASTVFDCEYLGKVTIKQIYEKGWRVILVSHLPNNAKYAYAIIEEQ